MQNGAAQAIRYNNKIQKNIFYKSAKTLLDIGFGAETSVLILPYASAEFSINIFPSRYINLKIRSRFSGLNNTHQQTYELGFEMKPEGSSNFSNHGDFTSVSFFYGMKKTFLKNDIGENIYHYFDGRIEIAWSKYEKNDLFYSIFVAYATKYHNNFSNSSPLEKFNLNIGVHFYLI
jgi:hypothetical protein